MSRHFALNTAYIPDIIGMIGVALVLLAYAMLNMNKINNHSMLYQVMNLVGSILLLISLFFHWNIASVAIEIAWISISLIGILRVLRTRRIAVDEEDVAAAEA